VSAPEIIVDPNVWVSALISPGGTTAGVLRAVLSDEVTAIVTPHLLEELSGVLERDKFRRWVSLADARAFVAALSDKADLRADTGKSRRSARDPDDDYLVALADRNSVQIGISALPAALQTPLDPRACSRRGRCADPVQLTNNCELYRRVRGSLAGKHSCPARAQSY
jgi:uncharacterized protein